MKLANYLAVGILALFVSGQVSAGPFDAKAVVERALEPTTAWQEPAPGPKAQRGKSVVYLAATLRNGGILAVGEGMREASDAIDWSLDIRDARGDATAIDAILAELAGAPPDALVVSEFDAAGHANGLKALAELGTQIVAWHAGPAPGPVPGTPVSLNVTTDPLEVARVAAAYAIQITDGQARAVIFTDARYGIALTKSAEMARIITSCGDCEVLEIVNMKLDETQQQMPDVIARLKDTFGARWNVSLGINDLYFDDAALPLVFAGVAPRGQIHNISAGDGSFTAYKRIRKDSFQTATVPEPLSYQGWQIVDELNRLFAGEPITGFVAPTKLVVPDNVDAEGGMQNIFDPENGYRAAFSASWN